MTRLCAAAIPLLAWWPAYAAADPITISADLRTIHASASVTEFSVTDTHTLTQSAGDAMSASVDVSAGASSAGHASATLVSSIADPLHLWGRGTTAGLFEAPLANVGATSEFAIDFHLDAPFDYAFSGTFEGSGSQDDRIAFADGAAGAALMSGAMDLFRVGGGTFTETGVLLPGDYHFSAASVISARTFRPYGESPFSDFAFTLDLTPLEEPSPTPEAGSLTLMVLGLLGFYGSRVLQVLRF
jgi:hypothetical protein